MGAQWKHDCNQCKYVGSAKIKGKTHDFYYCKNAWYDASVVARYGSDRPSYESMPFPSCKTSPLTDAIKLAYQFVINSKYINKDLL